MQKQIWGACAEEDARTTETDAHETLKRSFPDDDPPIGYVTGKTQMRNAIVEKTGCSLTRAESIIESLENKGQIHYQGDSFSAERLPASWHVEE